MRQLNPDILLHTALFSPHPTEPSCLLQLPVFWQCEPFLHTWSGHMLLWCLVMLQSKECNKKKKSSSVGMKCVVCVIRGIRCNLRIVLLWHSFSWWQVTSLTEPLALCYVESQIARSLRCQIVCPVATRKRMSDVLPPNLNRKKGPKKKTKGIQCFIQWSIVSRTVSLSCSHMCKASV